MIQFKQLNSANLLFKNCRKRLGIVLNLFTCNILIKSLCKKANIDVAFWVLNEKLSVGMVPNMVTYMMILGELCGVEEFGGSVVGF